MTTTKQRLDEEARISKEIERKINTKFWTEKLQKEYDERMSKKGIFYKIKCWFGLHSWDTKLLNKKCIVCERYWLNL